MNEKNSYQLLPDKPVKLQEPTFGLLGDLVELGYNVEDVDALGSNYKKMTRDKDLLRDTVRIIFGEDVDDKDIRKVSLKTVKEGFYDFLGECGLHLI